MIADFIRDRLYGRGTSTTGAAERKRRYANQLEIDAKPTSLAREH